MTRSDRPPRPFAAARPEFDADGQKGLAFAEFGTLVDWCLSGSGDTGGGGGDAAVEAMSNGERCRLFEKLEGKDGDDDNEDIDDPAAFAIGVVRSACPLSFPRNCRDYWKLE